MTRNWNKRIFLTFLATIIAIASSCNPVENLTALGEDGDEAQATVMILHDFSKNLFYGGARERVGYQVFGVDRLELHFSSDGETFEFLRNLDPSKNTAMWTVPDVNTSKGMLLLVGKKGDQTATTTKSKSFAIDSVRPGAPVASLYSSSNTNNSIVEISISNCSLFNRILVNQIAAQPSLEDENWVECSSVDGGNSYTVSEHGDRTLYVWGRDEAGNISESTTITLYYDIEGPVISNISTANGYYVKSGEAVDLTWTSSEPNATTSPISIYTSDDGGTTWTTLVINSDDDGSESWTPSGSNATAYLIKFSAIDSFGNVSETISTTSIIIDTNAPTVNTFVINGGVTSTTTNSVSVAFTAQDDSHTSPISYFCIKLDDTSEPNQGHSCWTSVTKTPAPGLSASTPIDTSTGETYNVTISTIPVAQNLYLWVKDSAGHISSLSSAGSGTDGVDKDTITFVPGTPPVLVDVIAASVDDPASMTSSTNVPIGSDVYIKWQGSDAQGLKPTPVTLYYSTDDINFSLIATGLVNGQNGDCTVNHAGTSLDDASTGCYKWTSGSPVSSYYKVRVVIEDTDDTTAVATSTAMNTGQIELIAGNTETGLNYSAQNAMFFSDESHSTSADPHSLAIASNGFVFFKDAHRGLLYIDPADGVVRQLMAIDDSQTSANGDGGVVTSATFKTLRKILIDFQDRLLIYDDDRIRRIEMNYSDITASIINTIIGGGSDSNDTIADAEDLKLYPESIFRYHMYATFFTTPDGKIYFNDRDYDGSGTIGTSWKVRVYEEGATNEITSIIPGGVGVKGDAAQVIANCKARTFGAGFNPSDSSLKDMLVGLYKTTGECSDSSFAKLDPATALGTGLSSGHPSESSSNAYLQVPRVGMNGELYAFSRYRSNIKKYNAGTGLFDTILNSSNTPGTCADGTSALSCKTMLLDAFIDQSGRIYFVDQGRIRLIDDSGNVQTIFGQSFYHGDGGNALSARFHSIDNMDVSNAGEVVVLDNMTNRFRAFSAGGNIATIAGNGTIAGASAGVDATTEPILTQSSGKFWHDFALDRSTGDVYFNLGVTKVGRLDRGTGQWVDLFGGAGTDYWLNDNANAGVSDLGYYPARIRGFNGTDLLTANIHYSSGSKYNAQFKLYDTTNSFFQTHLAGDATAETAWCADSTPLASCAVPNSHAVTTGRLSWDSNTSSWIAGKQNSADIKKLTEGGNMATLTSLSEGAKSFDHYWDGANDILFYCSNSTGRIRKHIVGGSDTELTWPIANMECAGDDMVYDSVNDQIIFTYRQNNLMGVAIYKNP